MHRKQRKMSRGVLNKSPLITCGDSSVYQDTAYWKTTRFSGRAQEFSLENTEFQVAVSHPIELRKQLATLV